MSVCCESCVSLGRGLCEELITRPEESYQLWCFVECDMKPREWGGPGPLGAVVSKKKLFKRCSTGCFVKVAHAHHSPLNAKFLLFWRKLITSKCKVTLQNCNSPFIRAPSKSLEFIRGFLWSPNEQIWKPMPSYIKIKWGTTQISLKQLHGVWNTLSETDTHGAQKTFNKFKDKQRSVQLMILSLAEEKQLL
jgi:hypothetical protein